MSSVKKFNCIALSLIIVLLTAFISDINVFGDTVIKWEINGSNVNVRKEPTTKSSSLGQLSYVEITVHGDPVTGETVSGTNLWRKITYGSITGYVLEKYIKKTEIPVYVPNQTFEQQLAAFPESYKAALRALHAEYPNWKFVADNINMTFNEAVNYQIIENEKDSNSSYKLVETSNGISWRSLGFGAYDFSKGDWIIKDSNRWVIASREVVKYYVDPRSYLNTSEIFAFLPQDYNPTLQTEEGVKSIIKGTFLEQNYSDPNDTAYGGSYAKVIMEAGKRAQVNPYILAAKIIQEQSATSPLISGTYTGYAGYYNFFNVQAYGTGQAVYVNGLKYAKEQNWNSRSASIIGGAAFCKDSYIDKYGQNTYYYMNFNVKNPNNIYHQYATSAYDTSSKAKIASKGYKDLKTAELVFNIPVYKDMPSTASALPAKEAKRNNYYFTDIAVSGLTPSFNMYSYSYDLSISADTTVKVKPLENAVYTGEGHYKLKTGINTVTLKVKSESGYTTDYIRSVKASKDCILYIDSGNGITPVDPPGGGDTPTTPTDPEPPKTVMKGDTNGDDKISLIDLANVQKHLLKIKFLTGDNLKGADTNGDGKISLIDLANIQKHLLKLITLT